jgi:hypothetical protein
MYSIFYRGSLFSSFAKKKHMGLLREEGICFCISRSKEFSLLPFDFAQGKLEDSLVEKTEFLDSLKKDGVF